MDSKQKLKKCFFLHIPKCGGQTTNQVLSNIFGEDNVLKIWHPDFGGNTTTGSFLKSKPEEVDSYSCIVCHEPCRPILNYMEENDILSHYYLCTILRDPIDRTISWYNFILNTPQMDHYHEVSNMTFDDFVLSHHGNSNQCIFICGEQNSTLASQVLEKFDLVSTLENYDDFISQLGAQFEFPVENYKIINKSLKKKVARNMINNNTLNIMTERLSEDIELYRQILSKNH